MDTVRRSIPITPHAPTGHAFDLGEIEINNPDFSAIDTESMPLGGAIDFAIGPYRLRLEIISSDAGKISKPVNERLARFMHKVVALIRSA